MKGDLNEKDWYQHSGVISGAGYEYSFTISEKRYSGGRKYWI